MPEHTNTGEKGLEPHITQHSCLVNGFQVRHHSQYYRTDCLDEDLLFKFLDDTQPKEVEKLKAAHKSNYRQRIKCLISRKIKDKNVVNGKCLGGMALIREMRTGGR